MFDNHPVGETVSLSLKTIKFAYETFLKESIRKPDIFIKPAPSQPKKLRFQVSAVSPFFHPSLSSVKTFSIKNETNTIITPTSGFRSQPSALCCYRPSALRRRRPRPRRKRLQKILPRPEEVSLVRHEGPGQRADRPPTRQ